MLCNLKSIVHVLYSGAALGIAESATAAFLDDSKASLGMRNFYMNRDFRQDGVGQNKAEEWAQGFILRFESGYTAGPLGVGIDAVGFLGVKLDSSPDRAGTGLLKHASEASARAEDEYGESGLTAKLRASKSTLKVGTLQPILPPLMRNDGRLLPQTFRGAWVNSNEIDNLNLDLGRIDRVNQRNSSNNEELTVFNVGKRNIALGQAKSSNEFLFGGGRYQWRPEWVTSYYYGGLEGIYKQHLLNMVYHWPLGEGRRLKSDLRFARSSDDGGSNVDNDAMGALFTYESGSHNLSAGYQHLSGSTGFAYVNGADNALINLLQINDFGNQNERSWQVRYDYDFSGLGVPGLSLMSRYVSGDNVDRGSGLSEGKTWERNTDLSYVIQSGPLKDFGLKIRNASTRSNFLSDIDENRLIISYYLALW
ncbi:OprD family porin [Pseudomonas sp. L13]|uniref:OprD family porin n=1 Tax=Pseudomonas sp. L13 TaxID=343985 RepID=UPI00137A9FF5|nr:OprD family porin [Pseudomonas sp. L13]NCE89401.1 outer membrane porin, OprD family [Pseudomonas sp. L13]